jgi:hypothetical protein
MRHEGMAKLKTVGTRRQLTLGKQYCGRYFQLVELCSGELLSRPVRLVRDTALAARSKSARVPSFRIVKVEQVVMLAREQRYARQP